MDPTAPIIYFDRYSQQLREEKILGERALRWVYGSSLGGMALHLLIKRAIFSRLLGALKTSRRSAREIVPFIQHYDIDVSEVERDVVSFTSFDDFFTRKLRPGARPICPGNALALPADARHRGWQDASLIRDVYVKGQSFDLPALLDDAQLAEKYARGAVLLSRLCPVDYHRFHFPAAGIPGEPTLISGPLASVSPFCLRRRIDWLWTNKRVRVTLHTESVGDVLLLAIGATGVGSIHQTYTPDLPVNKGDEQGFFSFGGSTVMCFFEPSRVQISSDILEQTARGFETYARQGDVLGTPLT